MIECQVLWITKSIAHTCSNNIFYLSTTYISIAGEQIRMLIITYVIYKYNETYLLMNKLKHTCLKHKLIILFVLWHGPTACESQ